MLPCLPIPRSVTVLYVFAVVNLTALLNLTLVDANLIVLNSHNKTMDELSDLPAGFGPRIPSEGIWVLNAQNAGYSAAIVHNIDSDKLVTMNGKHYTKDIEISSIFISATDGLWLRKHLQEREIFSVILDNRVPLDANLYLLPFAIVVGICFVVMVVFMIAKWILNIRRKRRSRLSKANLKKIPVKKFNKGDPYDVCAICLDEYEEGEKLRVLPCSHAYHQKCVDPWLTKNKRTCPLCKKKVIPGDPDSSSEEESDGGEETGGAGDSETTPLLAASNHRPGRRARGGNTFENSGLPAAVRSQVRPLSRSDSDDVSSLDDEDDDEEEFHISPSTSVHQSSVEVHETPRLHRHPPISSLFDPSPGPDMAEKISVGSQTSGQFGFLGLPKPRSNSRSSGSSSSSSSVEGARGGVQQEEELGAVGGQPNLAFELVEDHFTLDSGSSSSSGGRRNKRSRRPPAREEIEVRVVAGGAGNIQESGDDDRLPPV